MGVYDGLGIFCITNKEQSRLFTDVLPQIPSYMKHLVCNYPDLKYLSRIVHGLMECYPDVPIYSILDYVNSWPGVAGKLSELELSSMKHSAQSSFIKSVQEKLTNHSKINSIICSE